MKREDTLKSQEMEVIPQKKNINYLRDRPQEPESGNDSIRYILNVKGECFFIS